MDVDLALARCARAAVLIAIVPAACGDQAAPAARRDTARERADVLALQGLGTLTARCRPGGNVTVTFHANPLTATDVVSVQAPGVQLRRWVNPGKRLSATVPSPARPHRPSHWDSQTPSMRWRIEQSTEPETIRASVTLAMTPDFHCQIAAARVRFRSSPHH
jgi:hypothetical protein